MATSSWTLPSLASQFTSRYPLFHGAARENTPRDRSHATVFEVLAGAGFTVLGVSANDFVSSYFRMTDGFDDLRFTGGTEGPEDDKGPKTEPARARRLRDWPGGDLALFVHYMDAHYTYDPPPPSTDVPARRRAARAGRTRGAEPAKAAASYDGEIAYMDSQIDLLLKELAGRGVLRDAVIVYSADHGEEFLDHGDWKHSRTLYEEVLRVPLALRLPGAASRRVPNPCHSSTSPRRSSRLSASRPGSFQGRSLMPFVRGGVSNDVQVYAETEHYRAESHRVAVRHGQMKYLLAAARGRGEVNVLSEELYDLAADPDERRPLPESEARQRMRRHALSLLSRGRAEAPLAQRQELPADLQERLRALGYLQ